MSCADRQKPELPNNDYSTISDFHPQDTLFRVTKGQYALGEEFGYVNQQGDTIIPFGKFSHSFTDTIVTFGIVIENNADKY